MSRSASPFTSAGASPHATPGEIWLDPRLLAAGGFAWGIVQHEYAHQVAYFLVGKQHRERLIRTLGARAWCHGRIGLAHHDRACELFVETLTWAFWPSRHNIAHPARHANDAARARRFVARAAGLRAG